MYVLSIVHHSLNCSVYFYVLAVSKEGKDGPPTERVRGNQRDRPQPSRREQIATAPRRESRGREERPLVRGRSRERERRSSSPPRSRM